MEKLEYAHLANVKTPTTSSFLPVQWEASPIAPTAAAMLATGETE